MCSKYSRLENQGTSFNPAANVAKINGRPVLQPKSNQLVPSLENKYFSPNKKNPTQDDRGLPQLVPPTSANNASASNKLTKKPSKLYSAPLPPKPKSPPTTSLPIKKGYDPKSLITSAAASMVSISVDPGSIVAARREEVAFRHGQRKMRIAQYGRLTKSSRSEQKNVVPLDSLPQQRPTFDSAVIGPGERRCSFITPNSDPMFIAYHDEEWGVPVHDDKMLFELLVLTSAQVGSDWTSVLKRRQQFREAFSGFDAELVAKFGEKDIISVSTKHGIDISQVRSIADNSNQILQVMKEFGSFDKYLWRFVNHKPMCSGYKSWHKVLVKSSKSETISKDMVKRGFRFVGPTVIHSFMQAAGLSNDHLVTCPRHLQCVALGSQSNRTK